MYDQKNLTQALTYCGALPFVAASLATALNYGGTLPLFLAYGAVIAAFMAGTIWTQAQVFLKQAAFLLVISNVVALLAFAAVVWPLGPVLSLFAQAACLLALLACDRTMARASHQPHWYFQLRIRISLIVLASYGLMIVSLMARSA